MERRCEVCRRLMKWVPAAREDAWECPRCGGVARETATDDVRRRAQALIAGAASGNSATRQAIADALTGLGVAALDAIEDALWTTRAERWIVAPLVFGAVMLAVGFSDLRMGRALALDIVMVTLGPALLAVALLILTANRRHVAWQHRTLTEAGNRIIAELSPPDGLGAVARGCTMPQFVAAASAKLREYSRRLTVAEARHLDTSDIASVCHLLSEANIAGHGDDPTRVVHRAIRILSRTSCAPAMEALRSGMVPRRNAYWGGSPSYSVPRSLHKEALWAAHAIESRLARYEYEQTLLRAASAEEAEGKELLRPAHEDEQAPQELLRPADSDEM